jgi:hypothetical protein
VRAFLDVGGVEHTTAVPRKGLVKICAMRPAERSWPGQGCPRRARLAA